MEICHVVTCVSVTLIVLGVLGLAVRRKRRSEIDVVELDEELSINGDDLP